MIFNDPISYSVKTIMDRGIDSKILGLMFSGMHTNGVRRNIASEIDKVLMNMCDDFSLVSGDSLNIDLDKCTKIDANTLTYYVPPRVRNNRDIRNVISVSYGTTPIGVGAGDMMRGYSTTDGGNGLLGGMNAMSSAISTPISTVNTDVELIDSNTFRIYSTNITAGGYNTVSLEMENRSRLKDIAKGSYHKFYRVALAYMKSYLYANRLTLKKASIFGGHEISDIESILSEYSGASDEYDTFLDENVGKMLFFADKNKTASFIADMV